METSLQYKAMNKPAMQPQRHNICHVQDLIPGSGICVLVNGLQFAVFYLPEESPSLYAVSNWDPIGGANVMSRGIVGDIDGELVVASPLYKQHFKLIDGNCLEADGVALQTCPVEFDGDQVFLIC